jgi:predicted thioesterase
MTDLRVNNHGTIFLVHPLSDAGREWVQEHLPADAQRFGEAVVVEHRYIADIVDGATNDGLEVA